MKQKSKNCDNCQSKHHLGGMFEEKAICRNENNKKGGWVGDKWLGYAPIIDRTDIMVCQFHKEN